MKSKIHESFQNKLMIKKIFKVVVILLAAINSQAREITGAASNKLINGTSRIITNDKTGFPNYIFMSAANEIPVQYFERWMRAAFKTSREFGLKEMQTSVDEKKNSHIHYQETWGGIPVANTMWIAHLQNGNVISCSGSFITQINALNDISMDESTALNFALAHTNAKTYRWQSPAFSKMTTEQIQNSQETFYPKGELMYTSVNGNNKDFRLCYRFDVFAIAPLSRNYIFVDANTGVIINSVNRILDADATGSAVTGYVGTQTIITDSFAGGYRLREADRGDGIETYNMETGMDYALAIDFTDADNIWNNVNANLDEYATDAHYGAEMTYDYYWLNHNRNSVDDNGMKLISYVHYDVGYYNAFWDGTEMTYGDGNGGPLTSLDVCGHEISHGVTQMTCGLNYQDEPGGLNEGYSDCIGTAVEFYGGGATADWLIGEDFGTPFRSMSDPHLYGQPDTYLGPDWVAAGGPDNGGVHTNSGVLNYWFYLMSVGGSGTNDNGDAYNITGLSLAEASDILYKAWRDYMFPTAQYADARQSTLNAATDIYGPCSPEVQMVADAWFAVGVGGPFDPTVVSDFSVDITTACTTPAIFHFQNLSANGGSYLWHFGDGTTSTAISPIHTYNNYGTFDVKLVTNGGVCGIDSITYTALIQVDSNLQCIYNMPVNGNSTFTSCDGLLYDNGGPAGNYTDNHNDTITIAPTNSTGLTLTFTSFFYENNYDYLYIYDGPTTASTLIGQYTNTGLPAGGTIVASSGSLTLVSTSDGGVTASGFAASWICETALPNVDFYTNETLSCDGTIDFTDITTQTPISWDWDFGDGGTSTQQNPTHTYTANGSYTVTLVANNVIGLGTEIKTLYITINLPTAPLTTDDSNCNPTSFLLNAAGQGGGVLNWYDAPTGGNLINTGSTFNTGFLNNTTTYYVEEEVPSSPEFVGAVDNNIGTTSIYTSNTDRYQIFDALAPFTLISCDVFADGDADRTFELLDGNGNILQDTTIYVLDGAQTVSLNWDIAIGTNYELGVLAVANLYRNTTGASYPYTIPGVISITGNSANNPDRWYFPYNWQIQVPGCVSARTPITATIDFSAAAFTYTNTNATYSFTDPTTAISYNWNFGDGLTDNIQNPTHTYAFDGTYTVTLIVCNSNCCDTITQTLDVTTGINNLINVDGFTIFPNPTMNNFTVNYSGAQQIESITLFNTLGEVEWSSFTSNKNHWVINAEALASGVYFLSVKSPSGISNFKLEKLN